MVLQNQPTDGDLGGLTLILLGVGAGVASLLSGGWLWTKHEELELEEEFNRWREIYQNAPYNMTVEEAIAAARGIVLSDKGFDFGFNATSAALVVGGLVTLYIGSQLVIRWLSPDKK
jgi:hypothetical protein